MGFDLFTLPPPCLAGCQFSHHLRMQRNIYSSYLFFCMGIVDPSYAVVFYDLSSIISRKFTLIVFFSVMRMAFFTGIQVEILNHLRVVRK